MDNISDPKTPNPNKLKHKAWLERLSEAFLREPHDREELMRLIRDAKERELIDEDALKMIEGVLRVSQIQVRDAMIPRLQMVTISSQMSLQEVVPKIIEAGHSRFPVTTGDHNKVIGILLAKDLLKFFPNPGPHTKIQQLVRPAIFIPESKRLNILLREFQLNRNHIAMVVDEYGNVSGLITIEDVLEEIVGQIEDEYDIAEEPFIKKITSNEYIVNALTPIEDFNDYFQTNFSHEEVDTISGLILQKLSHLPKKGEKFTLPPFKITIMKASNRGIQLLHLLRIEEQSSQDSSV